MDISVEGEKRLASRGREFTLRASFSSADEFVVLFGPSGSGKSLTLRAISGLMRPDTGRIEVDGRVLFDASARIHVPARDRGIGYLFQDYALFPHLSVADNVAFGLGRTQSACHLCAELIQVGPDVGMDVDDHVRKILVSDRNRVLTGSSGSPW